MTQTGQQIITLHILPNISRTKVSQAMKLGQLIEYNLGGWEIFFFKNDAENEAGTLVPGLFFVFKKGLYKVKTTTQYLSFSISS